jgi:four helix bundle protein
MNDTGRKEAWRKAHEATLQICRMASCSPEDERYELAAELVGAAQSLVMALASEVDTDHVVDAASGSLARLECLLLLAENLGLFGKAKIRSLRGRLEGIQGLIDAMNSKP